MYALLETVAGWFIFQTYFPLVFIPWEYGFHNRVDIFKYYGKLEIQFV